MTLDSEKGSKVLCGAYPWWRTLLFLCWNIAVLSSTTCAFQLHKKVYSHFSREGITHRIHSDKSRLQEHRCSQLRRSCLYAKDSKHPSLEPRTIEQLPSISNDEETHRIIFLRHGESSFNNAGCFTGWCDVSLTQRGVVEAIEAGEVFASHGLTFRKCYCSLLTRSIVTAHRSLEAAGIAYTPLEYDWRLNERHYGALQGLNKEQTAERLGTELVMGWRRSYYDRPPTMLPRHPHYEMIQHDPRYRNVKDIPLTESLEDCQIRVVKAWKDIVRGIVQSQASGSHNESQYSLVVAHANTLRALVMHLDDISASDIEGLNIPTAIPFYYDISLKTGRVVDCSKAEVSSEDRLGSRFRGIYISDERKKRGFLERRRVANDPWLWALHPNQVDRSMLLEDMDKNASSKPVDRSTVTSKEMDELEKEAEKNTELFSPNLRNDRGSLQTE